ncbi:hypothetical protein C8F01DRAFT_1163924 [Mycena amicta]|nr:hypothetical protein C8F01DRAFT_1163924 [Mycena amicta]
MAAFLRKKQKQPEPPPIRSPPPLANVAPPPLFARFATTANEASSRVVSSPMTLGGAPRNPGPPNGTYSRPQQGYVPANYGPSPPPNRRFSTAVSAEKPLPDPLSIQPPQSALPTNRRASAYPAQPTVQNPPPFPPSDGPYYRASGPASPPSHRMHPDPPQRPKAVPQQNLPPDMGATISSLQVQSFHPTDPAFKVNSSLLPAQPIPTRANAPRRSPSGLVKGKPLIFAAMASEDVEHTPPVRNLYPSPPMEPARSPPPRQLLSDQNDGFDAGFSQTVLQSLNWSEQPHPYLPRVNGNTPLPFQPPQLPPSLQTQLPIPQSPPRVTHSPIQQRVPLASLPSTPPPPPSPSPHRTLMKPRPTTPQRKQSNAALQLPTPVDRDEPPTLDPIRMLKPVSRDGPPSVPTPPPISALETRSLISLPDSVSAASPAQTENTALPDEPLTPEAPIEEFVVNTTPPPAKSRSPPSPVTPEDYRVARSRRRGDQLGKGPPASLAGIEVIETRMPGPFPLVDFILNPQLLAALLEYLSFYEWCVLSAVTKAVRARLVGTGFLREVALERYLRTVGYARWGGAVDGDGDPLELSLLDLHDYMRGVCVPSHEHARIADEYVQSFNLPPGARDSSILSQARNLTMSTRAYTRVVLRLRAQAEREASEAAALRASLPPPSTKKRFTSNGYASSRSSPSRPSSRAPSPNSLYSGANGHSQPSTGVLTFRSPLFRLKRAPLLRVFVPSPDGDWLSDKSVLECEAELKRAGVLGLLRAGDVVWDIAVGDEGNIGRLVWDGSYLIDLDYKYSAVGDLPQYLPTLAFPPSYFHRVIRTGVNSSNPVAHIDISPWGQEIAANLQLLQDRIRTETYAITQKVGQLPF